MSQAFTNLLYHCIFSTRDRRPQIPSELGTRLYPFLGGVVRNLDGVALAVGGVEDHVHLLLSLPPTIAISEAMRVIKASSSKWIHDTFPPRSDFAWQTGYGAFTVSLSNTEAVREYIDGQAEHHRTVTFQEEFLAFLKRHGVKYDERYIWQ